VSTASTNANYSPAWRASEPSPAAAARVLENAVAAALEESEGARLVRAETVEAGEYRLFE
jgi:hypothetical protein